MTEYQIDSDEIRKQNTSNTMEPTVHKSACLYKDLLLKAALGLFLFHCM